MKSLTLYQPWATLIVIGVKRIETRSWGTKYRGPIAIHCSKNSSFLYLWREQPFKKFAHYDTAFVLGSIIGLAYIGGMERIYQPLIDKLKKEDPLELSFGDYSLGRWAWILQNAVKYAFPVPAKGAMGLWEWEV